MGHDRLYHLHCAPISIRCYPSVLESQVPQLDDSRQYWQLVSTSELDFDASMLHTCFCLVLSVSPRLIRVWRILSG